MSKLDPQVEALLEQFKANAAQQPPPTHLLTADEKIAETRLMMKSLGALALPSEPILRVEDFDLPGPAGKIPVRLYVPKIETPLQESAPTFIYYHGGGFVGGDLESHDTLLRAIANRAFCLVLSVDYRLAPQNPYPAANDDALAALNWVVDHASEIGADPERLAVGGDSAGGLLSFHDFETAIQLAYERGDFPTLITSIRYRLNAWKTLHANTVIFAPSGAQCEPHLSPDAIRDTAEAV